MKVKNTQHSEHPSLLVNQPFIAKQWLVNIARFGCIAISLIFILLVLWHITQSVPSADDFCYGARARDEGIIENVILEYFGWGGRFSATFLIGAFAASSELLLYHYYLVPLLILSFYFYAASYFIRQVGVKKVTFLIVFFCILLATFRMREALFWLAGGFTYGLACALFLMLITNELSIFSGNLLPSWKRVAILSVASFFLAGFNETIMLAHIALLLPLSVYSLIYKKESVFIFIILAAIIGACVVGFAPGNFMRPSSLQQMTILLAGATSFVWVFQKYAIPFLVFLFFYHSILVIFLPNTNEKFRAEIFVKFIPFLFFALWAAIFARAYVLNDIGPSRAQTVDFMLVNVMSFLLASYLYKKYQVLIIQKRNLFLASFIFTVIMAIALAIGFISSSNKAKTKLEGLTTAASLKRMMTERFVFLQNTKESVVKLPRFTEPSPVTLFNDIEEDPKDWQNACYARYFRLKEISLSPNQ